ncbi:DUF1566 domain-containing protein [Thermodesulfobacteriota bacterium]
MMMKILSLGLRLALVIIWSFYTTSAMSAEQVRLRSDPMQLSDTDVKSLLVKYNFFDRTKNPNGAFANNLVDNGDDTVTDRITGLMWQKNGSDDGMIWQHAKEYVQKLNSMRFAGYADWRLPTIEELASLMKSARANELYIHPIFSAKQAFFWSADTFGSDTAWYANFKGGIIQHIYDFFYYVRAVRSLR